MDSGWLYFHLIVLRNGGLFVFLTSVGLSKVGECTGMYVGNHSILLNVFNLFPNVLSMCYVK